EKRGTACEFECQLAVRDLGSEPSSITLHLRDFAGEHAILQAPSGVATQYKQQGGEHTWTIHIPVDAAQPLLLRLRGRLPANPSRQWTMPRIDLDGARLTEDFMSLVGAGIRSVLAEALEQIAEPTKELHSSFPSVRFELADTFWRAAVWRDSG